MLIIAEIWNAGVPLHETQDGGPNQIKVKLLQNFWLHGAHLLPSHGVVNDLEDGAELRRVDLLVFSRYVQGCYAQALEISFPKILPFLECLVNDSDCYK